MGHSGGKSINRTSQKIKSIKMTSNIPVLIFYLADLKLK